MKELRYTLVADGSSDSTLIPILNWLFDRYHPTITYRHEFAERVPSTGLTLEERANLATKLYPCDILFVHRDAERETLETRVAEIHNKLNNIGTPFVPVVPVRMTEAWLLSDENAIRRAAGNPNGNISLGLPPVQQWDQIPDPKETLFCALRTATELPRGRLKKFSESKAHHRVAESTVNFCTLERLSAFSALRDKIAEAVEYFIAGHK